MTSKYTWSPAPAEDDVITYTIEKSTDGGSTWNFQTQIPNITTSALYFLSNENLFFWEDINDSQVTNIGEIVRIRAEDGNGGSSEWSYIYSPPVLDTPVCNLYGAVLDTLSGRPRPNVAVNVYAANSRSATLINVAQFPGLMNEQAVALNRKTTVYTDNNGRWQIDVLPDQKIVVHIEQAQLVSAFRVPIESPPIRNLNFRDTNKYRIPMPDLPDIAGGVGIQVSLP